MIRTTDSPEEWQAVINQLTASWLGLRAARYIAEIRFRTGSGPTYSELFKYLWPEHGGVPSPVPDELTSKQQREVRELFRKRVSSHLARSGWIHATLETRSLKPGRRYH